MSHQIIKQPNGLYAVWSSIVDDFIMYNATPQNLIEEEVEDARERITQEISHITEVLDRGERYSHFMSWKEALALREELHKDIE